MSVEFKFYKIGLIPIEEFQRLYEISFHKKNEHILPSNVVVINEDGEYKGFLDLSHLSKTTVFLKYIGFAPRFSPKTVKYIRKAIEYIHSLGYTTILGGIEAKNRLALMWALREGFYPHGYKYMGNDVCILEIRKDQGVETGSYKRGL